MITSIEIENFRGIASGRLDGLAPLTILTGPNGCGKSTILDALLIGSTWLPGDGIGIAVARHQRNLDGGRWLFLDRHRPARLKIQHDGPGQESSERRLAWIDPVGFEPELEKFAAHQAPGPYRQISCLAQDGSRLAQVFFTIDNKFQIRKDALVRSPATFTQMIDPSLPVPLEDTYSEAWRLGKRDEALELMRGLVDDLQSIDILTEANREPRLYLTRKAGAVPVSLSGDGIQAVLQQVLAIALVPEGGLALIEEPEVFLHPRAIFQVGRALVEAMRQGRQIVLTTHSLELIDAILGYSSNEESSKVALFNFRLSEGQLRSSRWSGEEMRFSRNQIEDDLR